jgi:hypothetical protein
MVVMAMLAAGTTASAQFGNQENNPRPDARHGYQIDTNNPLFLIFPGLKEAPSPDWVKPGMRVTYFSASATIPRGDIAGLVQDTEGRWIDPATGQPYRVEYNRGSYGDGYNQLDVVSLNEDAVAYTLRAYGNDLMGGPVRQLSSTAGITLPGAAADWWMNPRVLDQTADNLRGPGVKSARIAYKLDDEQYNAVWISTKTAGGYTSSVIDLSSGLTLHYSSSYTSRPDGVTNLDGSSIKVGGGTNLGMTTFKGMRQLTAPWIGMPMPKSLEGVRQMVYEGEMAMTMMGNTLSKPMRVVYDFTGRGKDFIAIKRTTRIDMQNGMPQEDVVNTTLSGSHQLLPMAIPPRALAQLRNGQVIDKDPFTKVNTFVSFIGQDPSGDEVVTLTEYIDEKATRMDYVYQLNSGILSAMQFSDPTMNTKNTVYLVR